MRKFIYILLILFWSSWAFATDYHVTQAGGSGSNPLSASQFNALSGDKGGNTYYFSGTFTTRITITTAYGNSSNPMVLDGYEAGDIDPINDCDETNFTCDGNSASSAVLGQGISIGETTHGPDYITVQDFRITTTSYNINNIQIFPNRYGSGDEVYCDYLTIQRNYSYEASGQTFYVINGRNLTVEDNKFYVGGQNSASATSSIFHTRNVSDAVVRGNEIGHSESLYPSDFSSSEIWEIHTSEDMLIEYNEIYGSPQQSGIRPKEIGPGNTRLVIRFNKIHGNRQDQGNDEAGIHMKADSSSTNTYIYIYGNLIYNNYTAGILISSYVNHVYIWSNLIINNDRNGIAYGGSPVSDVYIYNNTIARNGFATDDPHERSGIMFSGGSSIYAKNNILSTNRTSGYSSEWHQIYDGSSQTYDKNTHYHASHDLSSGDMSYYNDVLRTLAEWNGETKVGTDEVADPNFNDSTFNGDDTDDYTLSAAGTVGADLGGTIATVTVQGTNYTLDYKWALNPDIDWTVNASQLETQFTSHPVLNRDDQGWSRGAYAIGGLSVSNESPTTDQSCGGSTTTSEISVQTDSDATCRASSSRGGDDCNTAYASLDVVMVDTANTHTFTGTGANEPGYQVPCGSTETIYVKCQDDVTSEESDCKEWSYNVDPVAAGVIASVSGITWSSIDTINTVAKENIYSIDSILAGGAGTTDYTADANCMGAWFMNNNGGNETDRSGEAGTLTQTGGTIPTSATVPSGYSGTSRDFESADTEYLEAADGGSTDISGADQAISFGAWVKVESDTSANQYLVSKYDNVDGYRQYAIFYATGDDTWNCAISEDGTWANTALAFSGSGLSVGTWTHIACVYNDTDVRMYVNGGFDSNGSDNPKVYTGGVYNGGEPFRIGTEDADKYTDGLIDEVFVFNRALTSQEVADIYNNGLDGTKGGND